MREELVCIITEGGKSQLRTIRATFEEFVCLILINHVGGLGRRDKSFRVGLLGYREVVFSAEQETVVGKVSGKANGGGRRAQ